MIHDFNSQIHCIFLNFSISFLVACTRLYKSLCPSVGRSVGWSVGHTFTFLRFYAFLTQESMGLGKL